MDVPVISSTDAESPTPTLAERQIRRRRRRRIVVSVFLVCLVGFLAGFHRFLFLGNVGVVVDGRLYRSAQPHSNLSDLVRQYNLGSILNLRGGSEKDAWYVDEVKAATTYGIELYDFPMSAVRRPRRKDLLTILDVFDRCKYPLLIHCESGSDRTGLAVGLYLLSEQGLPPEQAEQAFSLEHGHVPFLGPEHLHEPFDEYADWLAHQCLPHTPARFRTWVKTTYQADDPPIDPPPVSPGPRARSNLPAE